MGEYYTNFSSWLFLGNMWWNNISNRTWISTQNWQVAMQLLLNLTDYTTTCGEQSNEAIGARVTDQSINRSISLILCSLPGTPTRGGHGKWVSPGYFNLTHYYCSLSGVAMTEVSPGYFTLTHHYCSQSILFPFPPSSQYGAQLVFPTWVVVPFRFCHTTW